LLEERLDHLGDDVAWRDGVDTDAVHTPFHGQVTTELNYGCFARVIRWAYKTLRGRCQRHEEERRSKGQELPC
jgi:hypothetical protein